MTDEIPDGSVVLLDSVTVIYFLEENPRYFAAAAELFERIADGSLSAIASTLVLTEVLVTPLQQGDAARAGATSLELRRFKNLRLWPVDTSVAELGAELRARFGLRTPDAIHAATGLHFGAGWIVTNDLKLRRVASEGLQPWLFDEHV